MKLSIIVPVYNEAKSLKKILGKVEGVDLGDIKKEIIIVDDGSTDGSTEIIRNLDKKYVTVIKDKNEGKGSALKEGIRKAKGELIIFQDADLEYHPADYVKLMQPILDRKSKITFGSRIVDSQFKPKGVDKFRHMMHTIGNKGLTLIFNMLYGTRLTDVEPCYKMFKAEILKNIEVRSDGFEYDIELMCKVVKKGYKIIQTPIRYSPRTVDEGKKINIKDGFIALGVMLNERLR